MLLDSNIIIYAALPKYAGLQDFIAKHTPAVSAISRVEVLGYHRLTETDRRNFEDFFRRCNCSSYFRFSALKSDRASPNQKDEPGRRAYRRHSIGP
jgi:hypothetical protein